MFFSYLFSYSPIIWKHWLRGYYDFQAEELMRKIEKEEEQVAYDDPDKKVFHLCIVNLVIG